jgi:phosphatidylserine/phosphatidylglycerophosphate/cardiolipin synthase-like enzyme
MTVTPLTSPDNYFDSVFPMIRGAGERIWIQQQYIEGNGGSTIPRLLEAIAEKQRAGVDVRLMASSKFSSAWDASKATIQDAGLIDQLKAINLDNFLHLHNKGAIVDDAVVVSSTNWSENSVRQAREVGILIHSAAVTDFFSQVFDDDWRTGWSVATADSRSSSLDVTAGAEVEVDPADRV